MRILIFSDLHAHAFKPYSTILNNGLNSRLNDTLIVLDEIISACQVYQVDLVLFGGDLFHQRTPITVSTFNAVHEKIAKLRLTVPRVGLLKGNHDQTNRSGTINSIDTFNAIVDVFSTPQWATYTTPVDKINILCLPYLDKRKEIQETIKKLLSEPKDGPKMLLGHVDINGGVTGSDIVLTSNDMPQLTELEPESFSQMFFGHFHKHQKLYTNAHYVGSTHQNNWSDAGQDRGFMLWDTEKGPPEFIPIHCAPKFEAICAEELSSIPLEAFKNNFIRIEYIRPHTQKEFEDTKKDLLNLGARWVQWRNANTVSKSVSSADHDFSLSLDHEELAKRYIEQFSRGLDKQWLNENAAKYLAQASATED